MNPAINLITVQTKNISFLYYNPNATKEVKQKAYDEHIVALQEARILPTPLNASPDTLIKSSTCSIIQRQLIVHDLNIAGFYNHILKGDKILSNKIKNSGLKFKSNIEKVEFHNSITSSILKKMYISSILYDAMQYKKLDALKKKYTKSILVYNGNIKYRNSDVNNSFSDYKVRYNFIINPRIKKVIQKITIKKYEDDILCKKPFKNFTNSSECFLNYHYCESEHIICKNRLNNCVLKILNFDIANDNILGYMLKLKYKYSYLEDKSIISSKCDYLNLNNCIYHNTMLIRDVNNKPFFKLLDEDILLDYFYVPIELVTHDQYKISLNKEYEIKSQQELEPILNFLINKSIKFIDKINKINEINKKNLEYRENGIKSAEIEFLERFIICIFQISNKEMILKILKEIIPSIIKNDTLINRLKFIKNSEITISKIIDKNPLIKENDTILNKLNSIPESIELKKYALIYLLDPILAIFKNYNLSIEDKIIILDLMNNSDVKNFYLTIFSYDYRNSNILKEKEQLLQLYLDDPEFSYDSKKDDKSFLTPYIEEYLQIFLFNDLDNKEIDNYLNFFKYIKTLITKIEFYKYIENCVGYKYIEDYLFKIQYNIKKYLYCIK
ncbi:MAG: hypothetical protein U1E31_03350 [Rickettsiales bacterium]